IPHLTGASNWITSGETYTFTYGSQTLYAPWAAQSFGTVTTLQSLTISGVNATQSFQYGTTGELTNVTYPYGGQLSWTYGDFTFAGNVTVREVQQRQLVKQYGATLTNYVISRTSGDANTTTVHSSAFLDDPGGVGQRAWAFSTDTTQPAILGLP